MSAASALPYAITIGGTTVPVKHELVNIDNLLLDADNPRTRVQALQRGKLDLTQAELEALIAEQPGFDSLQRQIRKAGGITEALIVRHNGVVAEGNTRLAVARLLNKTPLAGDRFRFVPVQRLPKDLPERLVQLLMTNVHIVGKARWRPAAQAEEIYRLIHDHGFSVDTVSDETGFTTKAVEQRLAAYKFLVEEVLPEASYGDEVERQRILESKFSHADEFIKRKNLKSLRDDPASRKLAAALIATDQVTGLEVRSLPAVLGDQNAKAVLKKEGFSAAQKVAKVSNPSLGSKTFRSIAALAKMIPTIKRDELEALRTTPALRDTVVELAAAIQDLLEVTAEHSEGEKRYG